jgi:hypothetical protein
MGVWGLPPLLGGEALHPLQNFCFAAPGTMKSTISTLNGSRLISWMSRLISTQNLIFGKKKLVSI